MALLSKVIAAREAREEQKKATPKSVTIGEWVKCDGDWQQVLRFEGTNAILYTPPGHAYTYALEESETRIPRERANALLRRP